MRINEFGITPIHMGNTKQIPSYQGSQIFKTPFSFNLFASPNVAVASDNA